MIQTKGQLAKQRMEKLMKTNQLTRNKCLWKELRMMILLKVKFSRMSNQTQREYERMRILLRSRIRLYKSKKMRQGKLKLKGLQVMKSQMRSSNKTKRISKGQQRLRQMMIKCQRLNQKLKYKKTILRNHKVRASKRNQFQRQRLKCLNLKNQRMKRSSRKFQINLLPIQESQILENLISKQYSSLRFLLRRLIKNKHQSR